MKKLIALLCICGIIMIACNKKTVPTTGAVNNTETKSPAEQVNPSPDLTKPLTDPAKPEGNTTMPTAMDQGKTVFITKCNKCHGLKNPGDYTASRWDGILTKMIPNAKLSDSEAAQVTAYLKANAKQ